MLKKIALASIFAVVSIVSFSPAPVNAKSTKDAVAPSVGAPVMKGFPYNTCPGCK
jgi:hypothetical protein